MGLHVLLLQLCCALALTGHLSQSLAATPGDGLNDLLEKPTHQVSLLQVTNTPYWDRLIKRFTPEYSDSSGAQEMMQAQQHWRRSSGDKVGTNWLLLWQQLICCPMYASLRHMQCIWGSNKQLHIYSYSKMAQQAERAVLSTQIHKLGSVSCIHSCYFVLMR